MPERAEEPKAKPGKVRKLEPRKLTRAEAEHIEAEAAKMTVWEPPLILNSELERYEHWLERKIKGEVVSTEDQMFMAEYETGPEYALMRDRMEYFRTVWAEEAAGQNKQEAVG